jgi:hypothetical protein
MSAPVGSLAGEAALLLEAIAGRLESWRAGTGGPVRPGAGEAAGTDPGDEMDSGDDAVTPSVPGRCPQCGHDPGETPGCTSCPLCRLLALLRGERPETAARLVEGALSVVQALRALLPEPSGAPAGNSPTPPPGSGGVRAATADAAEEPQSPAPAGPDAAGTAGGVAGNRIERIVVR